MDSDVYQSAALRTYPTIGNYSHQDNLTLSALGLTGESGEFADIVKKHRYHRHPFTDEMQQKLFLELGDILWYVAVAAETLGVKLSAVMQANVDKLRARYPQGFSPEASLNRTE